MASAMSHDDLRSLSRQPPSDPDIMATLSDFLTYTEHFPSHMARAATLMLEQRLRCEESIRAVHDNASTYSILPTIKQNRPDPVELRKRLSYALEAADTACRMNIVEADRLASECSRESRKLDVVVAKLKAQPKPPSRDPTPEQQPLTSPNLKRERRLSTRAEELGYEKRTRRIQDKAASKLRGRKVMVPGEVLPPPDPNASIESMSDWTSPPASPAPRDEMSVTLDKEKDKERKTTTPRPRSRTPKPPKPRGPRLPGMPGTNAHSSVAGISTSNALLALTKPPDDAKPGSKWLPWLKLTEWEMAVLRKKMKKNAIWVPSQTMVRRQLTDLGRGIAGRELAKAQADATGEPFIDEQVDIDPTGPRQITADGQETHTAGGIALIPAAYEYDEDADAELVNRGMRLNEAKKLKRQRMQEELQEQLAREQGDEAPPGDVKKVTISPEATKKRKREPTPVTQEVSAKNEIEAHEITTSKPAPAPKKLKLTAPTLPTATSTKVPLAPAGDVSSSSAKPSRRRAATPQPVPKKPTTIVLKNSNKAVSEEPPNSRRANLRRASVASAREHTPPAAPSAPAMPKRRSRRPAPGIVTSNADDGQSAKVGVSQRKAAPKRNRAKNKKDDLGIVEEEEEEVPPDEPTYCICGDVSWGTMIACDNDECEKEWFHLECVGLEHLPPRRGKWFCPDCTKKGLGRSDERKR